MTENKLPKKWKMVLLTWLCTYTLVNILFALLMPHIGHLHNLLKTFILTIILVPLMQILSGKLQKHFKDWLYR
jgi:antibiotic biosynthesis monooxygenase (ABM) superfamily enzyme